MSSHQQSLLGRLASPCGFLWPAEDSSSHLAASSTKFGQRELAKQILCNNCILLRDVTEHLLPVQRLHLSTAERQCWEMAGPALDSVVIFLLGHRRCNVQFSGAFNARDWSGGTDYEIRWEVFGIATVECHMSTKVYTMWPCRRTCRTSMSCHGCSDFDAFRGPSVSRHSVICGPMPCMPRRLMLRRQLLIRRHRNLSTFIASSCSRGWIKLEIIAIISNYLFCHSWFSPVLIVAWVFLGLWVARGVILFDIDADEGKRGIGWNCRMTCCSSMR